MATNFVKSLWRSFRQLNLFDSKSDDEFIVRKERISTTVFIVMLLVILSLAGVVLMSMERTISKTQYSLTQQDFQYLIDRYPLTSDCPCSLISINYKTFVNVEIRFHQVCDSYFMDSSWIESIYPDENLRLTMNDNDLRWHLSHFWQIIRYLCHLSKMTVDELKAQLNVIDLLSPKGISKDDLFVQSKNQLNKLILSVQSTLESNLMAFGKIMSGNQLVSGLKTNFHGEFLRIDDHISPVLLSNSFENCSCWNMQGCPRHAVIYSSSSSIEIEGMEIDCLPIYGALRSSLNCYYEPECFRLLHPSVPIDQIKLLENEKNKKFTSKSILKEMFQHLMIDEISLDIDFDEYYRACYPAFCSYSYVQRFDFLFTITTVLGMFGVISTILRFLVPMIVDRISNGRRNKNEEQIKNLNQRSTLCQLFKLSIQRLFIKLWRSLLSLNIFESSNSTREKVSHQTMATKIFLFIMLLTTIIAGVYLALVFQLQTVKIENPSLETYEVLLNLYNDTLLCPCSQISIPYGSVLHITYRLHQICSSDLVSSEWLQFLLSTNIYSIIYETVDHMIEDFRSVGILYFQLLAIFCNSARERMDTAIASLNETRWFNDRLITKSMFLQHLQLVSQSFTETVRKDSLRTKDWFDLSLRTNHFLTATRSFAILYLESDQKTISMKESNLGFLTHITESSFSMGGPCFCLHGITQCASALALYYSIDNQTTFHFHTGLKGSCIPFTSILNSKIDWWYDELMLTRILNSFMGIASSTTLPNLRPLDSNEPTRFLMGEEIENSFEILFDETFIEEWTTDLTRFDLFYNQCRPKLCSYTKKSRYPLLIVGLILISIVGGLNRGLKVCVPTTVYLIFFMIKKFRRDTNESINRFRFQSIIPSIARSITTLNVYDSRSTDENIVKQERLFTRLYLIVLLIGVFIVLLFTTLDRRTLIKTIDGPRNDTDYERLKSIHSTQLQCPCSQPSISYATVFDEIAVDSFHPICQSSFLNSRWFTYLSSNHIVPRWIHVNDFRTWGTAYFRSIEKLCSIAKQSVNTTLSNFLSLSLISHQLIGKNDFYMQMDRLIKHFKANISSSFIQILQLIRMMIQGNAIINTFSSNWYFMCDIEDLSAIKFEFHPRIYSNHSCSCATSTKCFEPASLYTADRMTLFVIPGLRYGCNNLESLLQSSLECFTSSECFSKLLNVMPLGDTYFHLPYAATLDAFPAIDMSQSSFAINDTFEILTQQLFIESWTIKTSYDRFFVACNPQQCSYTAVEDFDALLILTSFLNSFSGLATTLRWLIPFIVRIWLKISISIRRRSNRVTENDLFVIQRVN